MSPRDPSLASDYLMDRDTIHQAKKDGRSMFEGGEIRVYF